MPAKYEYPPTEFDPKPRRAPGARSYMVPLLAIAAAVAIIDRITKRFIMHRLPEGSAHTSFPASFASPTSSTPALRSACSPTPPGRLPSATASYSFPSWPSSSSWACSGEYATPSHSTSVALALILGGAIGNVYDRVRYHYVVDFIEVHIVHYHWPDFNVADSCIVIGACLLRHSEIFRPRPSFHQSS